MTTTTASKTTHPTTWPRRQSGGRLLLALCAVAAAGATVEGISSLSGASSATLMTESWRVTGLGVFTGIFALLAHRPRGLPGIFELAIAHKALMTAIALLADDAAGATEVVIADGVLTIALLVSYVLTRAWTGWVDLRDGRRAQRPITAAGRGRDQPDAR